MASTRERWEDIGNYRVKTRPKLGSGSYGRVYKGVHIDTKEVVAVKEIDLCVAEDISEKLYNLALKELEIIRSLQGHKNIVQMLETIIDADSCFLFMEYCDGRDLRTYLLKNKNIGLLERIIMMQESSSAFSFMHGKTPAVVHRDVKLENILIKCQNGTDTVKISDFGVSKLCDDQRSMSLAAGFTNKKNMTTVCGTEFYQAPEFFYKSAEDLKYNASVDVFALGLVYCILLQYGISNDDIVPLSVGSRRARKHLSFGKEMADCYKDRNAMPKLFEDRGKDDAPTRSLKRIITYMTQFKSSDRKNIHEVDEELKDILTEQQRERKKEDGGEEITRMSSDHQNILRVLHEFLLEELAPENVVDCLFANKILSRDDLERVLKIGVTTRDKMLHLLLMLPKKEPKAYHVFKQALKDEKSYVVERMEAEERKITRDVMNLPHHHNIEGNKPSVNSPVHRHPLREKPEIVIDTPLETTKEAEGVSMQPSGNSSAITDSAPLRKQPETVIDTPLKTTENVSMEQSGTSLAITDSAPLRKQPETVIDTTLKTAKDVLVEPSDNSSAITDSAPLRKQPETVIDTTLKTAKDVSVEPGGNSSAITDSAPLRAQPETVIDTPLETAEDVSVEVQNEASAAVCGDDYTESNENSFILTEESFETSRIDVLAAEREYIQKKSFTMWVNASLKPKGFHIDDLYVDLRDGRILLHLLGAVSGKNLKQASEHMRGEMRIYKLSRVQTALSFLKEYVIVENIGAEDIVDGNKRLTLALIWIIILRFQIEANLEEDRSNEKRTAKQILLQWCQEMTEGYANVNVSDFTRSWRDGLAFSALIHKQRPDLIEYNALSEVDIAFNLNQAFRIAEDNFGLARLLDTKDIIQGTLDEKSIITYVGTFYEYFKKEKSQTTQA